MRASRLNRISSVRRPRLFLATTVIDSIISIGYSIEMRNSADPSRARTPVLVIFPGLDCARRAGFLKTVRLDLLRSPPNFREIFRRLSQSG